MDGLKPPLEFAQQHDYDVRLESGHQGLATLAARDLGTIVIVDVLSFTTCVTIAVERGAVVRPYPSAKDGAQAFAEAHGAILAGSRNDPDSTYSLSPGSLATIPPGIDLVLPSPNGSSLSFEAADHGQVVAGSLRNRSAVAAFVSASPGSIAVIAAGERWPDQSLRPSLEDYLGAGSIIAKLTGKKSPEAEAAEALFEHFSHRVADTLNACSSGRELIGKGFGVDVQLAAEVDACEAVPLLVDACYRQAQ